VSTSLLVLTSAVSCYPASMVNLIWYANENIHRVCTEQHGDMKSGISRSKNSTILQAQCANAVPCSNMWKSNYPHRYVNAIALHIFCGCNCETSRICHQWTKFFTIRAG